MKVLFLVSCALAVASAGWAPVQQGYHGPQHIPVIHNGVPVETQEVQHAKAAHYAALAEASAHPGYQTEEQSNRGYEQKYNGDYQQQQYNDGYQQYHGGFDASNQGHGFGVQHYSQPIAPQFHAAQAQHAIAPAYATSHVSPAIGHDGKPLDTPEVEAAKAHHFAAVHEALSRAVPQQHHYRQRRGLYATHYAYPQHIPVIGHNGVPVEPVEVQHARAAHLAAHASAAHSGSGGYGVHQVHAPVYGHHDAYTHYVPVIGHDGKPLDTPEVEYAKAAHFAAYHEAAARNSIHPVAHHGYAGQWAYGHHAAPVDTPEVQHAKAAHFAAHAAARAHHY